VRRGRNPTREAMGLLREQGFTDMRVASLMAVTCMAGLVKPLVHPTEHVKPALG